MYYGIRSITSCAKKYANFLNDYEPYQELRDFRRISQKFTGFSNMPIIFERDKSYKNDEPISDFLLNDWAEIIVSERIYKMLKEKYSNEIDFYECFANDEGMLKPYFILRRKELLDVLDKSFYSEIDPILGVMRNILVDNIPDKYNYFDVKYGTTNVISKKLYDNLKAISPTNFEVTPIPTTSEKLKAKEKNLAKAQK